MMAKLALLLICGFIPSILTQCSVKKVEQRLGSLIYDFSIDLFAKTAEKNENHFVTSTLSSWELLALLSLGASGTTLDELRRVHKLNQLKCDKYLKIANDILRNENSEGVQLKSSSYALVSNEIITAKKFRESLQEVNSTQFMSLSFADADYASQLINNYSSEATNGVINEVVSPGDFKDALLFMIDVVHFNGSWSLPFPSDKTESGEFFDEQGEVIGTVNLMFLSDKFNFKFLNKIGASVLELPYAGNKYSMLLFLPYDQVSIETVRDNLKKFKLKSLFKSFEKIGKQDAIVQIPRFKIDSEINMKELLIDMGLKSMFDSTEANFAGISHHSLFVSNFKQKAIIEVTEKGTVASAVTTAELENRSYPYELTFNKPFLFMIVNRHLKVPIFSGAYSKPSLY